MKKLNKSQIIIFYLLTFFVVVYFNGDYRVGTLALITFVFLVIYFLSNTKSNASEFIESLNTKDFFRSLKSRL